MSRKYCLLLFFLVLIGFVVISILVKRAWQADQFFEYQKQKEQERFETN